MTEGKKKTLIDELSDALMSVNSAQCVFHGEPLEGSAVELELENIWMSLYKVRQRIKDGLISSTQSKGEPEKSA